MDGYLTKPIDRQKLQDALERFASAVGSRSSAEKQGNRQGARSAKSTKERPRLLFFLALLAPWR